ncbi:tRNA 4-thiouridine(8) synthase ThiI [Histomonas meleagridis]|uniref:tRNA 4-thiouridine(8) synthase ThiI n=1 Tax=Histomonas meleagridis TaxID=135588 RepID=UPI003559A6AF|nr:tRNA 4-thiouridine(8) synthase ThiI [Histomonas meleagridis]KAH0796545.1 tRNA 4-thiouridine(8) synthase ThiI [Histomonas meleagridis]
MEKEDAKKEAKPTTEEDDKKTFILYHPHELWLKGKNRNHFLNIMKDNIAKQLKAGGVKSAKVNGAYLEIYVSCDPEEEEKVIEISKKVFGVANFSRYYKCALDIDVLKSTILEKFKLYHQQHNVKSFKVETKRQYKKFPLNSMQISSQVGGAVFESLKIPVDVKNPETTIYIEVKTNCIHFFYEKIPGAKGLPVKSSGGTVMLLSGGFDSPVASWMALSRGCSLTYVHFHSAPFGEWKSSISKIRQIVQTLSAWGGPTKFYAVPIGELQRQIATDAPERFRVTLYRRLMFRVAKKIGEKHKCLSLTTGDNLGQVASQTMESMTAIQAAISPFLVMRPLIGFSKEQILKKARKIGTHDISVLPGGDCCSHMLPKRVVTQPTIEDTDLAESKLDIDKMVETAIANAKLMDINEPWNVDETEEVAACPFTYQE